MTCAFRMKKEFAKILPSAIHIDNTARPQFVEKNDNENYYKILKFLFQMEKYRYFFYPFYLNKRMVQEIQGSN